MSRRVVSQLIHTRPYVCSQCVRRQLAREANRRAFTNSATSKRNHESVLSVLEERGLINQIAGDRNALDNLLRTKRAAIYAGIDPTAPSLHLGHLLPLMVLFWMSLYGHRAISLVGGGTARVGDPSGRLTSRSKTDETVQMSNYDSMFKQTGALWKTVLRYAQRHGYKESEIGQNRLLNNGEWLDKLNVLDFLKLLGNGMRLGTMLGKDTVKNKMDKGDGMSFSEFTYPLLQGWDWWHMYQNMGVQVQVGGSDQYGNIVAGMDAVRYIAQNFEDSFGQQRPEWLDAKGRLREEYAPMGLTVPLLTTSSGEKFGKSAGNAVWLDRSMTSPFDLYGFLLRSADADVERYLKIFTFVPISTISQVMTEHSNDPGRRRAQHLLASEVLELVHGRDEAEKTRAEHEAMRSPSLASLSKTGPDQTSSLQADPVEDRILLPRSQVLDTPISRILFHAGLASSKSEGARMVAKGGVYVATRPSQETGPGLIFTQIKDQKIEDVSDFIVDGLLILRMGKWKVRVIEIINDQKAHAVASA